jgi:uncharacterized membrane protein YfcA
MIERLALLLAAGAMGGALNSVAGGGSFIVFPSLLFAGLPAVAANATTTVALWPASLASAYAYRKDLPRERATLALLAVASAVGGGVGGRLLLATSDATFAVVLPWLLFVASAVFTLGPRARAKEPPGGARLPLAVGVLAQLVISVYGGYFGGGMGILMLATYTLMGMTNIHAMNGLKTLLGALPNGVAVVLFLAAAKVELQWAAPVAVGSIVGGFAGASFARRIEGRHVRRFVLVVAWSMTAFFFYRSTRR